VASLVVAVFGLDQPFIRTISQIAVFSTHDPSARICPIQPPTPQGVIIEDQCWNVTLVGWSTARYCNNLTCIELLQSSNWSCLNSTCISPLRSFNWTCLDCNLPNAPNYTWVTPLENGAFKTITWMIARNITLSDSTKSVPLFFPKNSIKYSTSIIGLKQNTSEWWYTDLVDLTFSRPLQLIGGYPLNPLVNLSAVQTIYYAVPASPPFVKILVDTVLIAISHNTFVPIFSIPFLILDPNGLPIGTSLFVLVNGSNNISYDPSFSVVLSPTESGNGNLLPILVGTLVGCLILFIIISIIGIISWQIVSFKKKATKTTLVNYDGLN